MACQSHETADFVTVTYQPAVDTILDSYTAWQTVEAWEYIKTATGKTVRALNQTTIKATLETLGCL